MARRFLLAGFLGLAVIGVAVGFVLIPLLPGQGPAAAPVTIGGPFELTDGDGRTVTEASFPGKWTVVYFGYTHCPDACPTALQDIANALDLLTPAARANVVPLFITVDPARDTPAVMKDYVSGFGPTFVALSGGQDAITRAEKAYRVYAAKRSSEDGDYTMDHSSVIYVMSPHHSMEGIFSHQSSPQAIADKLVQLGA